MRIFEHANYDFIGARKKAYIFSGALVLISLISLAVRGLEVGIDFTGGMGFVVGTEEPLRVTEVRSVLADVLGEEPEVKTYGAEGDELLIRTPPGEDITATQGQIQQAIARAFPDANPQILRTDIVGPRFAEDLQQGALYSILGSLAVIFVYVMIRFEWRYSLGALIALFHDVILTLGAFSLLYGIAPFTLTVDQTIIAALMTIVGFSINDTVVVFDRIRENLNLFRTESLPEIINKSINQTLSRTIITSGTVLLVTLVLFIFGGEVLRGFAFALFVGMGLGTYSSIFVAAPIVLEMRERRSSAAVARR